MNAEHSFPTLPEKIISGGQTGVDRAALGCGIKTRHYLWLVGCRKVGGAEDGPISSIYPMQETSSSAYAARTRDNVALSDATLILTRGEPSGGTKGSFGYRPGIEKSHIILLT